MVTLKIQFLLKIFFPNHPSHKFQLLMKNNNFFSEWTKKIFQNSKDILGMKSLSQLPLLSEDLNRFFFESSSALTPPRPVTKPKNYSQNKKKKGRTEIRWRGKEVDRGMRYKKSKFRKNSTSSPFFPPFPQTPLKKIHLKGREPFFQNTAKNKTHLHKRITMNGKLK